jgi:hypothetical protein
MGITNAIQKKNQRQTYPELMLHQQCLYEGTFGCATLDEHHLLGRRHDNFAIMYPISTQKLEE